MAKHAIWDAGRNPAIPLFTRFYTSQVVSRISEPSTVLYHPIHGATNISKYFKLTFSMTTPGLRTPARHLQDFGIQVVQLVAKLCFSKYFWGSDAVFLFFVCICSYFILFLKLYTHMSSRLPALSIRTNICIYIKSSYEDFGNVGE